MSAISDVVVYLPKFFSSQESTEYQRRLLEELTFSQGSVRMMGEMIPEPRLTHFAALDTSKTYSYSGKRNHTHEMSGALLEIKERIEKALGITAAPFDSVLVNQYRTGKDHVSWHSDDEHDIDLSSIASVSFGVTRRFLMRRKDDHKIKQTFKLAHGDLLHMRGDCQQVWEHRITPQKNIPELRLNLTFRRLLSAAAPAPAKKQKKN